MKYWCFRLAARGRSISNWWPGIRFNNQPSLSWNLKINKKSHNNFPSWLTTEWVDLPVTRTILKTTWPVQHTSSQNRIFLWQLQLGLGTKSSWWGLGTKTSYLCNFSCDWPTLFMLLQLCNMWCYMITLTNPKVSHEWFHIGHKGKSLVLVWGLVPLYTTSTDFLLCWFNS